MASKRLLLRLFGETVAGMADYYRYPEQRTTWGGPFNGQQFRQELFGVLVARIGPAAIIETGSYLGTTTEFMAQQEIPLYTVEQDLRKYGFVRARFFRRNHVTVRQGDSRAALRWFFDGPLREIRRQPIFAYLDAHWSEDLPLAEELDIVFTNCPAAVVMVDDFLVPHDSGYGFDAYGPGKALTPQYIESISATHSLVALYPTTPSASETGKRRGCVVLAKQNVHGQTLTLLPHLRPANA
jgi:hypothetical protein